MGEIKLPINITSVLLHCITAQPTEAQYSCNIYVNILFDWVLKFIKASWSSAKENCKTSNAVSSLEDLNELEGIVLHKQILYYPISLTKFF